MVYVAQKQWQTYTGSNLNRFILMSKFNKKKKKTLFRFCWFTIQSQTRKIHCQMH